ncbi:MULTISPECIES: MarR family winged helix-turn-helix transcriptional regulator [unclassified Actinopolyspora]|uniref:MarR family winged helix-turn-helix transcriptional regulator n=1 Tax=unclassified Actinopolyspora TaxID=2639451 RepID=UPI001A9999AF|nr:MULTISPECIES: MarR family winged helix-turn-helix transcriptional regulator [unclassified Actinopolyspora]
MTDTRGQVESAVNAPVDVDMLRAGNNGPGHLSRRLFQAHGRLWQDKLDDKLTGPQFTVLGVLCLEGPMDQRTLGEHARLDKSTTTPLLERLQQRELLDITKGETDKRRKILTITEKGRSMVAETAPLAVEVGESMLAPLSEAEREQLLRLLRKVC